MEPIAIKVDEAAELTHIGREALYEMMKDKRFPVFQVGRNKFIPLDAFRKYINSLGIQRYGYYE